MRTSSAPMPAVSYSAQTCSISQVDSQSPISACPKFASAKKGCPSSRGSRLATALIVAGSRPKSFHRLIGYPGNCRDLGIDFVLATLFEFRLASYAQQPSPLTLQSQGLLHRRGVIGLRLRELHISVLLQLEGRRPSRSIRQPCNTSRVHVIGPACLLEAGSSPM